jgi:hypothetical protein
MYRTLAIATTVCGCWLGDAAAQMGTGEFDRPVLRVDLTPRTRLVVQPAEQRPWHDAAALYGERREAGVGLEFKTSRKKGLPPNLLRVQMTSNSTLQFRPRGGGLAVTYREQF